MFTRTFSLLLLALCLQGTNTNAQSYGVKMDTASVAPHQMVCMPVYAKGFTNMFSFQYIHHWDASVLQFDHVERQSLSSNIDSSFAYKAPNSLWVLWSSETGLPNSVTEGDVLYKICFITIGIEGTSCEIYADGNGFSPSVGSAEAFNSTPQNIWNAQNNEPGMVNVEVVEGTLSSHEGVNPNLIFSISPNPTQSTAQIRFNTTASGTTLLSITDAAGRRVLEQKIEHTAGENIFQIPKNALISKGLYQVTLQNGKEISTQVLSVL